MAPNHLRLLLVLDQVVVQSLSSSSFSKENSLKPKVLAEVSIEVWSLQANVTSVESNWASLSWASHLRDVLLGVAPSPWVQVGWRRNLVEKLYGKSPTMELITSQGNGMRASSEVELSRYWEMTSWILLPLMRDLIVIFRYISTFFRQNKTD